MKQKTLMLMILAVVLAGVALLGTQGVQAGIYNAGQGGEVTYKEYWINHDEFTGVCNSDGSPNKPGGAAFIEPGPKCTITMDFKLPDSLANATKAEIYLDFWRNRDPAVGRYRFNGVNNPVHTTDVGFEYSRNAVVADVPLNEIFQGDNTITFTGTRLYQVQDVAIRVYYDEASPLQNSNGENLVPPTGALTNIAISGNQTIDPYTGPANEILLVDNNQLTLTADVAAGAKFVEFHAYYDGYDEDRDGDFTDWHNSGRNNWFPGGRAPAADSALGGTINHIKTVKAPVGGGTVSATWDLTHVVNQSGVRFKIRIVDNNYNIRDAAGGQSRTFTLARNYSVFYLMIPDFEDYGLHMFGTVTDPAVYKFTIPDSVDLARVQKVLMLGAYTFNPRFSVNGSTPKAVNPSSTINPNGDKDMFGLVEVKASLINGENTIVYTYSGSGGLNFVEAPGPMFIFRNNPTGDDVSAPYVLSISPQADATNVDTRAPIVIRLGDAGAGVDPDSIIMSVDGKAVTPKISGNSIDMMLTYTPPQDKPYENDKVINVTYFACDLLDNCFDSSKQFSFTTKSPDVTPPVISNIIVTPTDTTATITWTTNEAADSTLRYGKTTAYELPEVTSPLFVTAHTVNLTGLTPDTLYNYQLLGRDQDDNEGQTSNLTFKTKPSPSTIKSDDFSSCTLDTEVWSFINPLGDSNYTLNGSTVTINVPADVPHDIWKDGINAPRLMQLVQNQDFTTIAKIDSNVTKGAQLQGILVQQDSNNYLRFTVQYDKFPGLTIVDGNNGSPTATFGLGLASPPPYIRVVRLGNVWSFDYSYDDITWTQATTFSKTLTVSQIGIFAGNAGGSKSPAHAGVFDYFFNSAAPIVPEDPPLTLTVNKVGVGEVTRNPVGPNYNCNDTIQLDAEPATDWAFMGWSGALTSSNPQETFVITEPSVITATFENALAYSLDVNTEFIGGTDGGIITVDPQKVDYKYNDVVTLTADPAAGWAFTGWAGSITSENPTETLTITSNVVVTGTFARQINLTTDIISNPVDGQTGPGGEIVLNPDKETYDFGETVELQAVPEGGWIFNGWGGDLTGTAITETLVMTEDRIVTAEFTQESYTVEASVVGTGGTVTIEPEKAQYLFGEIVTVTAIPESDLFDFNGWGGDLTGTGNPAVFPVEKSMVITASFIPDTTPIEIIDHDVQVFPGGKLARVTWTTDVPGSSLVDYGLTPFYEVGDESNATLKTQHVIDLQDLEPEKLYYYQITSVDQYGNAVTVQDQFSTRAITGIVSDDFALCGGLNPSVWSWVDPLGDSSYDMTGNGVSITIPAGIAHDVFTTGNSGARIMQQADDKDFVVVVKFDSKLESDGVMQGIVIEQDDENFMRFDFYRRKANEVVVYSAAFRDLTPVYSNNKIKIANISPLWMRITRTGDTWLQEYSTDGNNWQGTTNKPFTHEMSVRDIGVFGGNFTVLGNVPEHTVVADYFFNMNSPITNEDQPYSINVQTVGSGSVTKTPDSAGYYCGQAVDLLATPNQGWVFAGWNGDVSGTLAQRTVTVERDLVVNALFVQGQTFYSYVPSTFRP
jgi:regulation of enolase protein 1 (concanavalin A-like superfamily)